MDSGKRQTAFRLDAELLRRLKISADVHSSGNLTKELERRLWSSLASEAVVLEAEYAMQKLRYEEAWRG